jgi:hypothetical protein
MYTPSRCIERHHTNEDVASDTGICCNICLQTFNHKEEYVTLRCNHMFHYVCLKTWWEKKHLNCPLCGDFGTSYTSWLYCDHCKTFGHTSNKNYINSLNDQLTCMCPHTNKFRMKYQQMLKAIKTSNKLLSRNTCHLIYM